MRQGLENLLTPILGRQFVNRGPAGEPYFRDFCLNEKFLDHVAVHVGEAVVASLEFKS